MWRIPALLIVLCCAATVAATASGSSALQAAAPSSFTDPSGDAGDAPDVTTVTVSNDTNGQVTFLVNFPAAPSGALGTDIYIDSDRNGSTGDPNTAGADWDLYQDWSTHQYAVGTWNGSSWVGAPATTASVSTNSTGNQLSFSINRSEIGNTSGFNFWVDSYNGQGGAGHEDQAPDNGLWSYTIDTSTPTTTPTAPLQLSVVRLVAPKTVAAGKGYAVAMFVKRSDSGDFLGDEGTVRCTARAAGHAVAVRSEIVSVTLDGQKVSALGCLLTAPRKDRGKLLTGTINASYNGVHVTRSFSAKIK